MGSSSSASVSVWVRRAAMIGLVLSAVSILLPTIAAAYCSDPHAFDAATYYVAGLSLLLVIAPTFFTRLPLGVGFGFIGCSFLLWIAIMIVLSLFSVAYLGASFQ